jgi:hypothetical protein
VNSRAIVYYYAQIGRRLLVADQPIDAIADDDLQWVRTWRYAVSLHVDVCAE